MATTSMSITSLISAAWNLVMKRYMQVLVLLGVLLGAWIVQVVLASLDLPGLLESLLSWIVSTVAMVIYVVGGLQLVRGAAKLNLAKAWADPKVIVNALIVSFLLTVMVTIGFLLLIIPGIYLALTYGLSTVAVVDEKLGPMESLKRSAALTQGNKMFLLVFGLVVAVVNVLGALALGIGLLVTVPVTGLAGLMLYDKLKSGEKATV